MSRNKSSLEKEKFRENLLEALDQEEKEAAIEAKKHTVSADDMNNIDDIVKDSDISDHERDVIDGDLANQSHGYEKAYDENHANKYRANPYKAENFDPYANQFALRGKDPSRTYKQISFKNFKENGFRDERGWVPLTIQNKTTEDFPSPKDEYGVNIQNDGFYHVGDRIWAWMPRSNYIKIRKHIVEKANRSIASITKKYRDETVKGKAYTKEGWEDEFN